MNVLELFAGCGGLGYGFHKEGFNIICANELEKSISKTYKKNFPKTTVITGDITDESIRNDIYRCFQKEICDVIIGGPPCVAYSMSGKRNSRDPRGQLFKDYVNMVDKLKPKIFIMENVKGILTMYHDKEELTKEETEIADKLYELEEEKIQLDLQKKQLSKTNNKKDLLEIKKKLESIKNEMKNDIYNKIKIPLCDKIINYFHKIGYKVEYKLFNTANFNVPQKRERVIFIGTPLNSKINIKFPNNIVEKKNWKTIKESIDDLKDKNEDLKFSHLFTKHSQEMITKIENLNIGQSINPKYKEAFYRCPPNEPSPTVKENHGGVFIHYDKHRVMTPRELARLQTFPDSFLFEGTKASILKQIGNAVPCLFSIHLAQNIKTLLS